MLRPALHSLVGDAEAFLEKSWARAPHLCRGEGRAGSETFSDWLGLEQVDHIVSSMSLRAPAFRLVRQGCVLPPSSYLRTGTIGSQRVADLPDTAKVLGHFHDGATIVLQGLQRWWPAVAEFCADLEAELTHPVQANAYVTPPGSQGLKVHHDTHDVFAVQTHGRKRWVTYAPVVSAPLASQGWSRGKGEPGEPTMDIELLAGDCLYLPRGTLHAATTTETEASVHLTLGVRAVTWHDVLGRVVAGSAQDERFRAALPAGFAGSDVDWSAELAEQLEALAAWVRERDVAQIADEERDRFWETRPPRLPGQLAQLLALDEVGPKTVVQRRPGAHARMDEQAEFVRLHLGERSLRLPTRAASALRMAVDAPQFAVGELPGLDAPGRVVLVRRLIREGLLRAVE